MRNFWALPALLRVALASQHAFSVNDDLLAFPQYEVKFVDDYVSELDAQSRLNSNPQPSADLYNDAAPPPSQVDPYQAVQQEDGGSSSSTPQSDKPETRYEYEMMTVGLDRYLCSIPQVSKPSPQAANNDTLSKADEEKELARASDRGWELLAPMQGNCVFFLAGWWSYRFCYNQGVRQFHQLPPSRGVPVYPPVEDPGVDGFMLGSYEKRIDGEQDGDEPKELEWEGEAALEVSQRATRREGAYGDLVQKGETRYLVQKLGGGTVCDLTGRERRVEVQFHCNPTTGADRISLIKEIATCAYLLVVQTPRLCNDVAFMPPQKDQPNTIACSPIIGADEVEDYEAAIRMRNSAIEDANIWLANAEAAEAMGEGEAFYETNHADKPSMTVGDVVVGAHTLVPKGQKIELSALRKETYLDTVADSEGRLLSKEAMAKLGITDPKAIEKLRKRLEEVAAGKEWKLDAFDTPTGKEYRGIIAGDEEGKSGESKGEDAKKAPVEGEQEEADELEGSEETYKEEL